MAVVLSDFLVPEAVCLDLTVKDASEAITILGDKLAAAGVVKDTFVAAALSREETMPTGLPLMGDVNAAMPHTDIEHVNRPGVGLATLNQSVAFRNMVAPDEEVPVRLVFLLALDQPKSQIEMLQQVAGVLQNPEVVSQIMSARDVSSVQAILRDSADTSIE